MSIIFRTPVKNHKHDQKTAMIEATAKIFQEHATSKLQTNLLSACSVKK